MRKECGVKIFHEWSMWQGEAKHVVKQGAAMMTMMTNDSVIIGD